MIDTFPYEKVSEAALDDERFDQPCAEAARPGRTYVICTTPRSGSWLLCRQLYNAGIGVPSEYFGIDHVNALYRRWNVDPRDTRAYLKALREHRTTRNGVFGTKLLWAQFADRRPALKIGLLRDAHLLYLQRGDLASQVVSLHLSIITGRWGFDDTTAANRRSDIAIGDERHLADCERMIREQQRSWQELFDARGVAVARVYYENLVADQAGAVDHVARLLGLSSGEYRIPPAEQRESAFDADIDATRRMLVERWRQRLATRQPV